MKKVIIIILIVFLFILCSLIYINRTNSSNINKLIKKNYADIKLLYTNKYNSYYIFISEKNYGVLDKNYEEILLVDKENLCKKKKNYDIIYKDEKLMYEEEIFKNKKLTFNYYDIDDCKLINSISLGGSDG